MRSIAEGGSIEVVPAEMFAIERRALDGAGYRTSVETPDGVVHIGTHSPAATAFGGRPKVEETFRCKRPGNFEIRFVSGRPWQDATHVVTSKAVCR